MADTMAPTFVMSAARDAISAGLGHIEEQVKSIELAVGTNPGLAFDLARTLVESVCRAVLTERAISFNARDELPKLFKAVTSHLPFLPPETSDQPAVQASLKRTLGGLSATIQGICELRNQCGFASHGSGTPRPVMEATQALLAASAADAVVGFLHRVHRQDRTPKVAPQLSYDDHPEFNDTVDDTYGVIRIFSSEFRPSQVLFEMERETYRVSLAEFSSAPDDTDAAARTTTGPEPTS